MRFFFVKEVTNCCYFTRRMCFEKNELLTQLYAGTIVCSPLQYYVFPFQEERVVLFECLYLLCSASSLGSSQIGIGD